MNYPKINPPQKEEKQDVDVIDLEKPEDGSTGNGMPCKTVLFNDDLHVFDEVILQIIKAVRCSPKKAESIAIEAHTKGRAIAYDGTMPECLRVSNVLEQINLRTEIEVMGE